MIIKKADSLMNDSELNQLVDKVKIWSLTQSTKNQIEELTEMFNRGGMARLQEYDRVKPIPKEDLEYWTIDADEYNFIINNSVSHLIVPLDTLATYSLSDSILVHSIDLPNFDTFNLNGSLPKKIAYPLPVPILKPTGGRYNFLSLLKNSSSYQNVSPDVDKMSSDVENIISKIIEPNQDFINTKYLNRSNIGMIYLSYSGNITPTIIVQTRPNLEFLSKDSTATNLNGNYSFLNTYFEPSAVTYLLAKIRKILYRKGQPDEIRGSKDIKGMESRIERIHAKELNKNIPNNRIVYSNLTEGLLLLPAPYAIKIWEGYMDAVEKVSNFGLGGDIKLDTERLIIKKLKRNFKNFMQDNSYTKPLSIKRIKERYTSKVVGNIIREAVQTSLPGFKQGDGRQQGFNLEKSDGGLPPNIENLQEVLKSPLERLELEGKMAFLKTGELEINNQGLREFTKNLSAEPSAVINPNTTITKIDKMLRSSDYLTTLLDGISSERLSNLTLKELLEILYDNEPDFKKLLDSIVNRHGAMFLVDILSNSADGFFLGKYIKNLIEIDGEKSNAKIVFNHTKTHLNNINPAQGHTVVIIISEWDDSSLNERQIVLGFKFNENMGKEGLVIEEVDARIVRQRGPQASFTIDMNASSDYYIEVRKVIKRIFSPELFYSPAGKTASGQVGGKLNPMHRSAEFLSNSIKNMLSSNPNIVEVEPFKYDALTNAVRGIYIVFNPYGMISRDWVSSSNTLHAWVTVDSRKAGPVRSGSMASGSMCMGSFMLSKTSNSFTATNSNCINASAGGSEETLFPVLVGGGSSATLDVLASLMTALGYLNSNPSTGVSPVERQIFNQLESVYVPPLAQGSENKFKYRISNQDKDFIMGGFGIKSLIKDAADDAEEVRQLLNSVTMTSKIEGYINLMDTNTFNYKLFIKGEGLGKLIDYLGLHSFTLGQSSDTAEKLVLQRSYSFKVNREVLGKFINDQKNHDNKQIMEFKNIVAEDDLNSQGENSNSNGDRLSEQFKPLLDEIGTVNGLITNINQIANTNEDYIHYHNDETGPYRKEKKLDSTNPTEEDSEIIMLKQLILFINIKDEKTLTLENFKEFINKNKSDIINKIITETTLGADYRSRGNDPGRVLDDITGRKLM